MKVIGYVRVSTREQADDGVSLDAQREKLQAYSKAMDLELVAIEEDAGVSAKTIKDRPGLLAALQALEDGKAEGIWVCKLDRLTRSVRDLGDLVERYFATRWSLMSVADSIDTRSASGRLILNVLACVSQWEREATAERTRDALSHLQRSGVLIGGAPLGRRYEDATDDEGRRVVSIVQEEERTVAEIVRLREANLTYRAIAQHLSEHGFRTKRGGRWAAATVQKVYLRAN
jgi:site-specific DNA recombinase